MKKFIILLIPIAFFVAQFFTLSDYGINEDSPGHFIRGQAYLQKFLTGDYIFDQPALPSPLLFIYGQRISQYKINTYETPSAPIRPIGNYVGQPTTQEQFAKYHELYGNQSIYKHNTLAGAIAQGDDGGHPPFSDVLSAASNRIFYEAFGLLGDIESYHLYIILTAVFTLASILYFTYRVFGRVVSFFSGVTLALFPWFFAEAHFNIKDIPELSFFTGSLIAFYFWVSTNKKRWFFAFLAVFLFGLGTKLNILFLPFILIPWLVTLWKRESFKRWFSIKLFIYTFFFLIVSACFFVAVYPYLWDSPFQRILNVLNLYATLANVDTSTQLASKFLILGGFDLRGLLFVIGETPLLTLFFSFVGLILLIKAIVTKSKTAKLSYPNQDHILLLLWLFIPILRVVRPGADVFGSIRQFAEFLPALAIIAAIGISFVINKLNKVLPVKKIYRIIGGILYSAYLLWILINLHPNENLYFNSLFGGLQGVSKIGLLDFQTSYDNPYRQAINWLNTYAEKDARLAFLDGTMVAIPSIWLRPDIHFGSFFSGYDKKGEYVVSLVYPQPPAVFPYLYLERFLQPVYEIKVQGVPILKIWKNSPEYTKEDMSKVQELENIPSQSFGKDKIGSYWEIDLGKEYAITSLDLTMPQEQCSKRDGLFSLPQYFVPQRKDLDNKTSRFYFPAEKTSKIRFYQLVPTCFYNAIISRITF